MMSETFTDELGRKVTLSLETFKVKPKVSWVVIGTSIDQSLALTRETALQLHNLLGQYLDHNKG